MCEVNGIEDAADAVVAVLPDYNNYNSDWSKQQRRIVELELALGRIARARTYDDIHNQTEVWELEEIAREALKETT
jgi:hypothetical protein